MTMVGGTCGKVGPLGLAESRGGVGRWPLGSGLAGHDSQLTQRGGHRR